jgi:hypothetical protein
MFRKNKLIVGVVFLSSVLLWAVFASSGYAEWMDKPKIVSDIEDQISLAFLTNGHLPDGWDPTHNPLIGMDHISIAENSTSYSCDYKGSHFIVLNIEPQGSEAEKLKKWVSADLEKANKRGMSHKFVFGPKPALIVNVDDKEKIKGLDSEEDEGKAFWKVILANKATYFTTYEYNTNVSQPNHGKAFQVLIGSGGSPYATEKPQNFAQKKAWVNVTIYESGKVHMDVNSSDTQKGEIKISKSWDLAKGY